METLYQQLAEDLRTSIQQGGFQPGDRLPGVRQLSRQRNLSIATVISAYRLLEDQGVLESRQRSGFYVRPHINTQIPQPRLVMDTPRPAPVTGQDMVLQLIKAANNPSVVQLGAAVPAPEFLPTRAIEQALIRCARQHRVRSANYEFSPGSLELRRQLARRMAEAGCAVNPDNLVITNGGQEALSIALRAVTKPGDVVAIESPAFYGLLQVLESLGLEALEIPTHPLTGISIEALELAVSRWPVKACVVVPNFSNPLGACMPVEHKQRLVTLLDQQQIVLIEDDIYGDLSFSGQRPPLCMGMTNSGNVILCSSVSKTLSPGLRVGWIAPGRFQQRVEYMKYVLNLATPTIPQLAVADLLESGVYERHLRKVRGEYAQAVARMTQAVSDYFPEGTRVTRPQGGFVIWLELPGTIDAFDLARRSLENGISIAPGPIFSPSKKYQNFIRLSCACVWNSRVEKALVRLAGMIGS
jgi:DNA-binding transcriptional MocR family regulator